MELGAGPGPDSPLPRDCPALCAEHGPWRAVGNANTSRSGVAGVLGGDWPSSLSRQNLTPTSETTVPRLMN